MDALCGWPHLQELNVEVVGHKEAVLALRHADRSVALSHLRQVELSANLPYLPLLLRPLDVAPSANVVLSCPSRPTASQTSPDDDFRYCS